MNADESTNVDNGAKKRTWIIVLAATVLLLAFVIGLLPTLVVKSGKIQAVIKRQLAERNCNFSMEEIRVGWTTPIRLKGIAIDDQLDRWRFSVHEIEGNRNLWQLITAPRDLGTLVIDSPDITVRLDEPDKVVAAVEQLTAGDPPEDDRQVKDARIRVIIRNGAVHAYVPKGEAPVDVATQIALDATWQQTAEHRLLSLAPGRIVKDVTLTPQLCELGIEFVAPVLSLLSSRSLGTRNSGSGLSLRTCFSLKTAGATSFNSPARYASR